MSGWRGAEERLIRIRSSISVRPVPADQQLAAGLSAGESPGHLERQHESTLAKQVHDQYQYRDELLARRSGEFGRMSSPIFDLIEEMKVTERLRNIAGHGVLSGITYGSLEVTTPSTGGALGAVADERGRLVS
jgi:hypothetical protein